MTAKGHVTFTGQDWQNFSPRDSRQPWWNPNAGRYRRTSVQPRRSRKHRRSG